MKRCIAMVLAVCLSVVAAGCTQTARYRLNHVEQTRVRDDSCHRKPLPANEECVSKDEPNPGVMLGVAGAALLLGIVLHAIATTEGFHYCGGGECE